MSMLAPISHLFLPQESNNFRARLLHHSSLYSLIGVILVIQLLLSAVLIARPAILGFASQISPEKIVELTNLEREKTGVSPLRLNNQLSEAAQRKAGDMFAFNYWAHSSPSGRDPWSFFKEAGYRYLYAGENLARDFSNPEAVVAAWMASPTHRDNLLNPKYQEIGISVVDGTLGGVGTTLVVQHLGTPSRSASVPKTAATEIAMIQEPKTPSEITTTPTPEIAPVSYETPGQPVILAQAKGTEALISPFVVTKGVSTLVLGLLIGVVVMDGVLAYRRRIVRLTGRSLAHFLFLGLIILIVVLSTQGVIL